MPRHCEATSSARLRSAGFEISHGERELARGSGSTAARRPSSPRGLAARKQHDDLQCEPVESSASRRGVVDLIVFDGIDRPATAPPHPTPLHSALRGSSTAGAARGLPVHSHSACQCSQCSQAAAGRIRLRSRCPRRGNTRPLMTFLVAYIGQGSPFRAALRCAARWPPRFNSVRGHRGQGHSSSRLASRCGVAVRPQAWHGMAWHGRPQAALDGDGLR